MSNSSFHSFRAKIADAISTSKKYEKIFIYLIMKNINV